MSLFGNVNVKVVCMQIREIKVALNIKLGSIPDHCYVNSILHRDSTLDKMQKYEVCSQKLPNLPILRNVLKGRKWPKQPVSRGRIVKNVSDCIFSSISDRLLNVFRQFRK